MMKVIQNYVGQIPMFGVCLGFQALIEHFGGELVNLEPVRHGIQREIITKNESFFSGLNFNEKVGLYHSWAVTQEDLPTQIKVLAVDFDQIVMAIEDQNNKFAGVQFHPESVMTPQGAEMLKKWINKDY